MVAATPLVFRPSVAQRLLAGLLCLGSWLVGIRALAMLMANLPRWMTLIRTAQAQGEPTLLRWGIVVAAVAACLACGMALLMTVTGYVLIEGCQVLVDDLGLAVEYSTLPGPLARWFGAGRLSWKQILKVDKHGWSFVVKGNHLITAAAAAADTKHTLSLRFMMVDDLERLILLILERCPHIP
jgi:hypothetical protein